jgi:hypothetical protein
MTDIHRHDNLNQQDLENDRLDRELDAELAKFAKAEPRAGIEERVLANLRAEQARTAEHLWWRWPALAALAGLIVVFASLAWRLQTRGHNIASHSPAATQTPEHIGTQLVNNGGRGSMRLPEAGSGRRLRRHAISHPATFVASTPRLDQFPSPQPLSEQEKMLAAYVTEHLQQAVLIARARTAELKKDWAQEMQEASANSTSDSPVIQQENR